MTKSALARGALGICIGFPSALIVGTGASFFPASPVEGLFAGVVVSGVLFVALLVFLAWTRGHGPFRRWLFKLHSLFGLVAGIALVAIVFSGALLVFRGDIETWSHDWLQVEPAGSFASVDAWLDAVAMKTDLYSTNRIDITWPKSSTAPVEISVSGPEGFKKFYVDPYRAKRLEGELSTWMDWIRELHTSLHLKRAGHWLVGLIGLATAWIVISGLFMQRRLFRDWRVLRVRMGSRILVGDLHKRLASLLFPFVILIAFSGMLLAFFEVLSAGPVQVRFDGNRGETLEARGFPQRVSRTEPVTMPSLESFTRKVSDVMPGAVISEVRVIGFGDRNAIVSVRLSRQHDLAPRGSSLVMNFRVAENNVILTRSWDDMGIFERFNSAMIALHIADFDQLAIRTLYALASVVVVLLPILGFVMWALRRRDRLPADNGRPPEATH